MTNTQLLQEAIRNAGISITFLARQIGITRESLYAKMANRTEFKASEIVKVTMILRLTKKERDAIFFANLSELNSLA